MPPPLLATDIRGAAGVCTCFRYVGATPSPVGDTFGTRLTSAGQNPAPRHTAKQYKGNIYSLAQDGVYVKDDPTSNTGPWSLALAFGGTPITTTYCMSGLHVVYVNDAPILAVCWKDSTSNQWRWAKFDGTTWTQAASGISVVSATNFHDVIVYRNVIHLITDSAGAPSAITFDPASESFANPSAPFDSSALNMSMCIFNDRLLAVYFEQTADEIRVAEFTGSAWVDLPGAVAGYTANGATYLSNKMAAFTDGTNMYAMVIAPDDGWRCLQWDASLGTPMDISTTVLPAGLLGATDGGTYPTPVEQGRWLAVVDQDTDPTMADIWLYQSNTSSIGSTWGLYQWNGPGTLIGSAGSPNDSGGDVSHGLPTGSGLYSGDVIWTAGELDIVLVDKQPVVGGQKIFFRCYGAAGAADKTVRFFYNTEGEPALAQATLTGTATVESGSPAGSPSRVMNEVQNVDADGTVLYSVVWDIAANSISTGDRVQLKPQILI